jgi:hypothetical protein
VAREKIEELFPFTFFVLRLMKKKLHSLWNYANVRWGTLACGVGMIVYGIVLIAGHPTIISAPRNERLVLTAKPVGEV